MRWARGRELPRDPGHPTLMSTPAALHCGGYDGSQLAGVNPPPAAVSKLQCDHQPSLLPPPGFFCGMLAVGLSVFPLPSLARLLSLLVLLWSGVTMSPGQATLTKLVGSYRTAACSSQKYCFSSRDICFPNKTYWWLVSYLPFPPLQLLLSSPLLPELCCCHGYPFIFRDTSHPPPQCRVKFPSFTLHRELPPSKVALIEHEML